MSIYLNLLSEQDLSKAIKIQSSMVIPSPSDFFDAKMIEQLGWTEEDCVQKLIENVMPEKTKEKKTGKAGNITAEEMKGGAAIFIPKKKIKKIKYPKNFNPTNPGPLPDPERWLPKWQRSKFKKMAKKKGIYLKGAQGDAQISTDVT